MPRDLSILTPPPWTRIAGIGLASHTINRSATRGAQPNAADSATRVSAYHHAFAVHTTIGNKFAQHRPAGPGHDAGAGWFRIAALCAAHPGPTPVFIEWGGGRGENGNKERDENGSTVRLRSRTFRVDAADDLLAALRVIGGWVPCLPT